MMGEGIVGDDLNKLRPNNTERPMITHLSRKEKVLLLALTLLCLDLQTLFVQTPL